MTSKNAVVDSPSTTADIPGESPLTPVEQRAKTIAHIRSCTTCGCDDPELMAGLDDPELSDQEVEDFAKSAHEYLRYERRQAFLRRNL